MTHPLGSPFVRDQLSARVMPLNERRVRASGEFVLYWMRSTQRFDDNWALRHALLEADRIGRPLLVVHACDPSTHASARSMTFAAQGARDLALHAPGLGLTYRFALSPTSAGALERARRLSARAALVVTDVVPGAPSLDGARRIAEDAAALMVGVDSYGVVPASRFIREEYSARTFRPKLASQLAAALEQVTDRPPRVAFPDSLLHSLDTGSSGPGAADIGAAVARCDVDHGIGAVSAVGGIRSARARLAAFLGDGLREYSTRRMNPSDAGGTSRLSPWLSEGMISPLEVARAVLAAEAGGEGETFLEELVTWRELALNFCTRNPLHATLEALPGWAQRSMEAHACDVRQTTYPPAQLEAADTHDELWNAGQRELAVTGQMHGVVRALWGKSVIGWSPTYEGALAVLLDLNDRYSLDGRDPTSYAGILWCFGKFDRPFATRPVYGSIRPMSLGRAVVKYDVERYVEQWRRPVHAQAVG